MRLKVFCKIKENAHGYFNQAHALNFVAQRPRIIFALAEKAREHFFARSPCLASTRAPRLTVSVGGADGLPLAGAEEVICA
jgi:hypothetical protein